MEKVKLIHATELGQPVFGTSNGSTYFCCAIATNFKIAIRDKSGSLSLRVEPNNQAQLPTEVQKMMKQLGFGGSSEGDYMSQHFSCDGGPLAACGAYGAIMEQVSHLFGHLDVNRLPWIEVSAKGS